MGRTRRSTPHHVERIKLSHTGRDVLRRTGYATIQEPDDEYKGNIPSLLREGWRFSGSPAICILNITEDGGSTK
ncbi:hypothetical protein HPB52_014705 [Rhipicephalus sanguineus]|uniref:Uncharacterized protein n=1 Tax=Rhipicephalus sanguineus TaxID=34632 RepID=A0A9D4SP16_RHISA|nr:hypothetical protein HPB52_014705 [Rhipicephalus sanguineus]